MMYRDLQHHVNDIMPNLDNLPISRIDIPTHQHPFPLDREHAALIIIDMQNDFCHPDGFCGSRLQADLSDIQAIIPRIQAAIAWARASNLQVIFTRESHKPDFTDVTPSKKQRYINAGYPIGSVGKMGQFLLQGEAGTQLIPQMQPLAQDWQLDKPAQSIFVGTDLSTRLQQQGISHLIFTGVTTECCVLGSYRHASDLGFYCLLLEDCCGALTPEDHQAAIDVLLAENGAVGWVTTLTQLVETSPAA